MKKLFYIIISIIMLTGFNACQKNLQDLNTDPEKLGETDPRYVFTGATMNWNNAERNDLTEKYSGVMQLMQYIVSYGGAQNGIYNKSDGVKYTSPSVPYYGKFYGSKGIGLRLRYLINTVIPNNPNKEKFQDVAAIAQILEAYEAWLMFDVYGAAPYNEAFKVEEGIKLPKYDLYKDMYKEFDAKVKAGVEKLSSQKSVKQEPLGNNDFFYKGDINKWVKFGNTLRIKMAQRLEKADKPFYDKVIAEALAHPGGIISNNDESCIYYHPNDHNNNTDDMCIITYQYCVSKAFVSFLDKYKDPRMNLFIRPNGFGKKNNNKGNDELSDSLKKYYPNFETDFPQWSKRYVGLSASVDSTESLQQRSYFDFKYKDYKGVDKTMSIRIASQIESRYFVKNGGKLGTQLSARDKEDDKYDYDQNEIKLFSPQITYSDVCFMMAEISLKAGKAMGGKDAQTWYKDGIRSSMKQYQTWGERIKVPAAMDKTSDNFKKITDVDIDAYLAQPDINSNVTLEKIVSQAWINSMMNPEEAWATWKRTGYPEFRTDPTADQGVAYFETIDKDNSYTIPRRKNVPTPNSANKANYEEAIKKLLSDPNYGTVQNDTKGRIWWDMP